jgi:hypothetical protein
VRISDVVCWIEGFHGLHVSIKYLSGSSTVFLSIIVITPTVLPLYLKRITFNSESQTGHEVQDVYESCNRTDRVWESFGFLVTMSFGGEGFSFNTRARNRRIAWRAAWAAVWARANNLSARTLLAYVGWLSVVVAFTLAEKARSRPWGGGEKVSVLS